MSRWSPGSSPVRERPCPTHRRQKKSRSATRPGRPRKRVLPDKGKPLLQAWAIVDNTIGEDWNNVELSLVAGAPQSFIQQISQPYYGRRPVVPLRSQRKSPRRRTRRRSPLRWAAWLGARKRPSASPGILWFVEISGPERAAECTARPGLLPSTGVARRVDALRAGSRPSAGSAGGGARRSVRISNQRLMVPEHPERWSET